MDIAVKAIVDPEVSRIATQIAAGVRQAEGDFVRRFERGLLLLARRHARPNEARVTDVVQVVLMHAIERMRQGGIRDPAALPAYLRTCVVREVAALYRDGAARHESTDTASRELAASDNPESATGRTQLLENVVRTIESLPVPRDREVLVRFYVREESKYEICAALGIEESHFRRVLFRARERLHSLMGVA